MCDKDRANSSLRETLASDFEKKVEELNREFDTVNILNWNNGVITVEFILPIVKFYS